MKVLKAEFFGRDTSEVARELLGKLLVYENGIRLSGMIVETEAYYGSNDPASHAARGKTKRNMVMFGPPGQAYIYLNYGIHCLLNVVTEETGKAGAVLIRAVEPIEGIDIMKKNRGNYNMQNLANGPGKLTQAFGIGLELNGEDLVNGRLNICEGQKNNIKIKKSARIGINKGKNRLLRFYISQNYFVSKA